MSTTRRTVSATPAQVWKVLSDGWLYPLWVVGATSMRDVDEGWPAPGTRLHHSVGTWPLTIDDTTDVVEAVPEQRLVLAAHAWPAGRAEIVLTLHPKADQPTSATETEIVFTERATDGPAALLPTFIQDPLLNRRNVESLRRLAFLVERR